MLSGARARAAQMLPGEQVRLAPPSAAPGFDSPAAEAALQLALADYMAAHPGKLSLGSHIGIFVHQKLGVPARAAAPPAPWPDLFWVSRPTGPGQQCGLDSPVFGAANARRTDAGCSSWVLYPSPKPVRLPRPQGAKGVLGAFFRARDTVFQLVDGGNYVVPARGAPPAAAAAPQPAGAAVRAPQRWLACVIVAGGSVVQWLTRKVSTSQPLAACPAYKWCGCLAAQPSSAGRGHAACGAGA